MVQMNFRANVRGMNPGQRMDAALAADVALRSGGMRVDAGVQVRGGVRAHFASDGYANARARDLRGGVQVTGMADLPGAAAAFYGGNIDGFQFDVQMGRTNARRRMRGADNLRNQAQIALNLGAIQPGQMARIEAQVGDVRSFAQLQFGGGWGIEADFQNSLNAMFQQQQMAAQIEQQQNMLHSLGMADALLAQRMGMQEANFNQFQGLVGNQLAQIGQHNAFQDQQLFGLSNGLGQLGSDLLALGQAHQGLSGVVDGLNSRLGALDGAFAGYRTQTDARFGELGASVDTRFSGVNTELASLLEQINTLKAELAAARAETTDLRATLGTETTRLDTRITNLEGRVETGLKDVNTRIDTLSDTVMKRIDDEVSKLQAADSALAGELKTLRGEFDGFVTKTQESFAEQSKRIDGAYKEIADTRASLTTQLNDVETRLKAAIEAGDANLQAQLNAQKTEINNIFVTINAHEEKIKGQEATLQKHAEQIQTAMTTANTALGTAKDAKGLAEWLRGQVNSLRGDVNQLQANDHSFSALLGQWWQALESWRGGHFLVNQGMQGNAHTRFDPLFFKTGGGELKFDGTAETAMLTGEKMRTRWLAAGDTANTAALLLDPAALKQSGFVLMNARGEPLTEPTLFRDGLRLQRPGEKDSIVIGDGWHLMKELDVNRDGKINKDDTTVRAIQAWYDVGTTLGSIDAKDTLKGFLDAGIAEIDLSKIGKSRTDAAGNTIVDGYIRMASGEAAKIADVMFGNG